MNPLAWLVEGVSILPDLLQAEEEIAAVLKLKAAGIPQDVIVKALLALMTDAESAKIHAEFGA